MYSTTKQFLIAGLAMLASGSAGAAAAEQLKAEVTDLQPFTHVAYIPVGADLSSIRFEGVKEVNVATKRRSESHGRYCAEVSAEPGGSAYCPQTTDEAPLPAYELTYSFTGQPMASDETANTSFTFSVCYRIEELTPEIRRALSGGNKSTAAAEFLRLSTSRDNVRQLALDDANSLICPATYVDGSQSRTNRGCVEKIVYKTVTAPGPYITARIDPAPHRGQTATAVAAPVRK